MTKANIDMKSSTFFYLRSDHENWQKRKRRWGTRKKITSSPPSLLFVIAFVGVAGKCWRNININSQQYTRVKEEITFSLFFPLSFSVVMVYPSGGGIKRDRCLDLKVVWGSRRNQEANSWENSLLINSFWLRSLRRLADNAVRIDAIQSEVLEEVKAVAWFSVNFGEIFSFISNWWVTASSILNICSYVQSACLSNYKCLMFARFSGLVWSFDWKAILVWEHTRRHL